jgi:hypothetical protein
MYSKEGFKYFNKNTDKVKRQKRKDLTMSKKKLNKKEKIEVANELFKKLDSLSLSKEELKEIAAGGMFKSENSNNSPDNTEDCCCYGRM